MPLAPMLEGMYADPGIISCAPFLTFTERSHPGVGYCNLHLPVTPCGHAPW